MKKIYIKKEWRLALMSTNLLKNTKNTWIKTHLKPKTTKPTISPKSTA